MVGRMRKLRGRETMFGLGNQRVGEGNYGNPGEGGWGGVDGRAAMQGHSKKNGLYPVDDGEPLKGGV